MIDITLPVFLPTPLDKLAASVRKLLLLLLLVGASSAHGQSSAVTQQKLPNPFFVQIRNVVQPVTIDDQSTLVYELHITNEANVDLSIKGLYLLQEIKRKKDTVFYYDEAALGNRMEPSQGNTGRPGTLIPPGETHILFVEASIRRLVTPGLPHLLQYQFAGSNSTALVLYYELIRWHATDPVLLSPPLRGGNWTAIYDPSWKRGHRRVIYTTDGQQHIPGRFAIDFMKVEGVKYAQQEDKVHSYYGYGAEVLAVADGAVASVCDSFPESRTLSAHPAYTAAQATGNYISLQIGPDRYAFYEHLQPGSITVKPGQQVKKGQVIARLGFTGQTTGPHLHFHVADQNAPLGAEGVPFVFDQFTLIGRYPDFSLFGKAPFSQEAPRKLQRQMPASNSVVSFK